MKKLIIVPLLALAMVIGACANTNIEEDEAYCTTIVIASRHLAYQVGLNNPEEIPAAQQAVSDLKLALQGEGEVWQVALGALVAYFSGELEEYPTLLADLNDLLALIATASDEDPPVDPDEEDPAKFYLLCMCKGMSSGFALVPLMDGVESE